jgi:uncharacterized protein YcsI (UPF0317 family)
VREGAFRGSTSGISPGFAQANLVIVPQGWAGEFREFCDRNPKPCPLLDVTDPGSARPSRLGRSADLRTDVPGYRIYAESGYRRVPDLLAEWRGDLVAFLLGCSFSFERALAADDIPIRHIELGTTVPMYISNVPCAPAGRLAGPMVVSMRPIPAHLVTRMREICAAYPGSHGEPVHAGDPVRIGIEDLGKPDFGDAPTVRDGEVPVFWACGVTPQVVLQQSGCAWFATHEPGHMFVSDCAEAIAPL